MTVNFVRAPVKYSGVQIGSAKISPDGVIELVMHSPNALGREIYEHVQAGVVFGLTISAIVNPAIDGKLLTRLENEKPLTEHGGIQVEEDHIHHNFD